MVDYCAPDSPSSFLLKKLYKKYCFSFEIEVRSLLFLWNSYCYVDYCFLCCFFFMNVGINSA